MLKHLLLALILLVSVGVIAALAASNVAFSITPSNSTTLPNGTEHIYVGGTGDLVVEMWSGGVVTYNSVQAGEMYDINVRTVYNSTTATPLLGLR